MYKEKAQTSDNIVLLSFSCDLSPAQEGRSEGGRLGEGSGDGGGAQSGEREGGSTPGGPDDPVQGHAAGERRTPHFMLGVLPLEPVSV